ncbi:MAG: hypothetical protein ACQERC_12285 [Bacteroidota bacterium]
MKLDDQNIDQLFNDAAHSRTAPQYDARYWDDIEAVLNEESRKKRLLVWFASGGGLVLALLIGILIGSNGTDTQQRYVQENSNGLTPDQWHTPEMLATNKERKTETAPSQNHTADEATRERLNELSTSNTVTSTPSTAEVTENEVEPKQSVLHHNMPALEKDAALAAENEPLADIQSDEPGSALQLENRLSPIDTQLPETRTTNKLIDIAANQRDGLTAYVQISGGMMENYKTSRPLESTVMNLSAGLTHRRGNIILRSGIGFQATTNADLIVSKRSKYYGFGVTNNQNDLSYQNLYDLYLPLEFGYEHSNTQFGMGIQLNYLVNSSMNLEVYENKDLVRQQRYTGVNNGLNQLSAQGYLWAEQRLLEEFYLGVKVGTHFYNRLSTGEYINESATTNPIYGQVSIRYNFGK